MHVLIVEDNAFNAFCLRRLLESVITSVTITITNNSEAALFHIKGSVPDMVVVDGDLGAVGEGMRCNGPELADVLLHQYPNLPLIAWSDSESMRDAFAQVFRLHDKQVNDFNSWTKVVSLDCICKTWAYYFGEFMGGQGLTYTSHSVASRSSLM